jgi:hypothetical protein
MTSVTRRGIAAGAHRQAGLKLAIGGPLLESRTRDGHIEVLTV